jgi:hypothetical protein
VLARTELRVVITAALERLAFVPGVPTAENMFVRGTVLVPSRAGRVIASPR